MKLESHLPERPGLLHATPVFDIFALLLLFFLMGPSFILQSGVRVDPPPSRFQLERFEETLVVTLVAGAVDAPPDLFLGPEQIDIDGLRRRLDALKSDGLATRAVVLLKSDGNTTVNDERKIAELILASGFRFALLGSQAEQATMPGEADE